MERREYLVTWEVDVEAVSPLDAALQARSIQRDEDSVATIFTVASDESSWTVDVGDEDTDAWVVENPDAIAPAAGRSVRRGSDDLQPLGLKNLQATGLGNLHSEVFLVGIEVATTLSREDTERFLHSALPAPETRTPSPQPYVAVESWWIAEDERHDRSDNDSAVFVKPGKQREAVALLREHGLAY